MTANRTVPESASAADTSHASAVEVTVSTPAPPDAPASAGSLGTQAAASGRTSAARAAATTWGGGTWVSSEKGAGGGQAAEARTAGWTAGAVGRAGAEPHVVRMKKYIVGTR